MATQTLEPTDLSGETAKKPITRYLVIAARVLLGFVFFMSGLNGFLNFAPPPATGIPEGAMAFGAAMMSTGYLMPLVKGTEVLCGALLLTNRFVPLALAMLAPVLVNIVAFHAFLAPAGVALPVILFVLAAVLAWTYRDLYRPMLAARPTSR